MTRPLLPIVILLALLACSETIEPKPENNEPKGWTTVAAAPVAPIGRRHDDVFFVDDAVGWIVNIQGEVYRTADSARTWQLIHQTPGIQFRAVGFASRSVGWAGNLNRFSDPVLGQSLYESVDGGATWTNITGRISGPLPEGICGIWVVDSRTIYAVGRWHGPAIFIRSNDGGQSWTSKDMRPLATGLVDVYFHDRNAGIIVGGDGVSDLIDDQRQSRLVILRTIDGGDTWERVFASEPTGTWGWKISFPTPSVGYVAPDGDARGNIYKTIDGGKTWSTVNVGNQFASFQGVGFVTADSGWAGGRGQTYETINGGDTWREINFDTTINDLNINRFRFLPNGDGFAIGRTLHRFNR